MSILSRFWNAIRNPVRYVGRDLQGNKFYESPSPNDPRRLKRTVQYSDPEDVWKYIGGGKRLAVQWSAWLTHTRRNPPTIEELQADVARQQRVLANVALIEARDQAEVEQRLRIRQQDTQRALADAAAESSGRRLLEGRAMANSTAVETDTTTTSIKAALTPSDQSVDSSGSRSPAPKFLPPTFLTPVAPRKPKTPTKFILPPVAWELGPSSEPENLSPPAKEQERDARSMKKESSMPSMPSRPVADTESWTPKAIRRG